MVNHLSRAYKFSFYIQKPIMFIQNPFGDGVNYWFVVDNWREINPSSHIHFNELKGKCINTLMEHTSDYDQVMFITKCDELDTNVIKFSGLINWVLIK
jgi:hypothetical protein